LFIIGTFGSARLKVAKETLLKGAFFFVTFFLAKKKVREVLKDDSDN
jgi:hypothetical protein